MQHGDELHQEPSLGVAQGHKLNKSQQPRAHKRKRNTVLGCRSAWPPRCSMAVPELQHRQSHCSCPAGQRRQCFWGNPISHHHMPAPTWHQWWMSREEWPEWIKSALIRKPWQCSLKKRERRRTSTSKYTNDCSKEREHIRSLQQYWGEEEVTDSKTAKDSS